MAEPVSHAAQAAATLAPVAPVVPPTPPPAPVQELPTLPGFPHVTFVDISVILLTATGVIVAAMAVILGVLAIFGWRAIANAAADRARRAINQYLQSEEFRANPKEAVSAEVSEQLKETVKVTIEHARNQGQPHADDGRKQRFEG